jgi:hypothetical protein
VIFHVLFEVLLLVEVRFGASLSAPKRTPDLSSPAFLFFRQKQQNTKAVTLL